MVAEPPIGRPSFVKPRRPEPMQTQDSVKWRVAQIQADRAKAKADSEATDKPEPS